MARRRGVRFVLILIAFAVFVSVTGIVVSYLVLLRGPSIEPSSTLMLRVRPDLTEYQPDTVVSQLVGAGTTVMSVVDSLRKAKVDSRISSVVLIPSGTQVLWGKVQEIRDAVVEFQESGKPIVAYLEYGGAQEYYLGTACDEIYLTPGSSLDLVGIATYELFLRGTLDKVGVYPDMLHAGKYKTAANVYTERTFTPEHREMSESLNRDLYDQLVDAIAEGRQMPDADVRALIDQGPFLAEEALRLGLIDGLAYQDELADEISLGHDGSRMISDEAYRRVSPRSLGLNRGPQIAVVYAAGAINFGESGIDFDGSQVVGSETMVEALRNVREDRDIRAVVLRIDSPGGAAVASDLIWREVLLTREDKPVVASMSDVAASGGYYIAMPADLIVAQPATLTGSIGVVGGKFALGGTFEKLGLGVESVSDGRFAELASPVRPFSPDERAKLQQQIQAIYDRFVEKAAQGRKTTPERINEVAQGRVWTGRQARDAGLVDELGGLQRALRLAKQRANIPEEEEVEVVVYPRPRGVFDLLGRSLPFGAGTFGRAVWGRRAARGLSALMPFQLILAGTEALRCVVADCHLVGREGRLSGYAARRVGTALMAPLHLFRPGEPLAILPSALLR